MDAEIICIGNEIVSGYVNDTNSGFISKKLSEIGVDTKYISIVGDDAESIISALDIARYRAEIIIITGGLGPTSDDITMETVANYFSKELTIDTTITEAIEKRSAEKNDVGDNAYKMALVPEGGKIFYNEVGVAPSVVMEDDGIIVVLLPGVPVEVESLMEKSIIPYLKETVPKTFIKEKIIKTHGIAESLLFEKLGNVTQELSELSFLPKNTGVDLKIRIKGENQEEVEKRLQKLAHMIEERLQDWIYSAKGEEFEEVIGRILSEKGLTMATAESCTGGLLANLITNVPGSSRYFNRGFVTYSNISKTRELGVSPQTIEKFGAVSEETAKEMVIGAMEKANVDIAVSTTGIAGPAGGSEDKPVGLVYVGVASKEKIEVKRYVFNGNRLQNKRNFAIAALVQLYKFLKE